MNRIVVRKGSMCERAVKRFARGEKPEYDEQIAAFEADADREMGIDGGLEDVGNK